MRMALAGLVLACACASASASACSVHTARPVGTAATARVDRAVEAPPYGGVTLGEPFGLTDQANRLADTLYQLIPSQSSGIKALTVHLLPDGRVSVIDVTYGPMRGYADRVAAARGSMGDPSSTRTDDDGSQHTIWQDARTRYEVVGRVFESQSQVSARLTDLLLARP